MQTLGNAEELVRRHGGGADERAVLVAAHLAHREVGDLEREVDADRATQRHARRGERGRREQLQRRRRHGERLDAEARVDPRGEVGERRARWRGRRRLGARGQHERQQQQLQQCQRRRREVSPSQSGKDGTQTHAQRVSKALIPHHNPLNDRPFRRGGWRLRLVPQSCTDSRFRARLRFAGTACASTGKLSLRFARKGPRLLRPFGVQRSSTFRESTIASALLQGIATVVSASSGSDTPLRSIRQVDQTQPELAAYLKRRGQRRRKVRHLPR